MKIKSHFSGIDFTFNYGVGLINENKSNNY